MKLRMRIAVLVFGLVAASRVSPAQQTVNYASVSGRILDPSGASVEGAEVTVRQLDTNIRTTLRSDREGRFRFPYLRVGPYEITVSRRGFENAARTLPLTVGSAFDLPIRLAIGSTSTEVVVESDAAALEAARSQIAGTLSLDEIEDLPLKGRNFLDLALMVPGVSPTNTASTQLFAETSGVPGQGISISSQRNLSNNFIVDGLSANDDAAGLSGVALGLGVVREFQVVTSGAQAEFGRALGGYVNVVTESGTNALHGSLYGYFRNQRFDAANSLSHETLPLTQAQYGAGLGGPIMPDRTFYFANFEQLRLNQSGLTTITPFNVAAINARLTEVGYPGSLISTGVYPNPVHTTNLLAKLDHEFGPTDQFTTRYTLYTVDSENSRGAGGLSAPTASAGLENTDQTLALGNVVTLSPRTVNETRGQFTHSSLKAPPSDQVGPAVSISGVASFGTLSFSPTARANKLYEVADNFTYQAGRHAIRSGVDFLYNDCRIVFPRALRGTYSFSSLANFLTGTYNTSGFTQTFGNPVAAQTNPNLGVYVQDEWKVLPKLTLNLGVRYDLQFLQTISTDTNNVSPRVGFAWSPFESRRTVIRGSYGLFYDRVPLRALANALLSAGNTTDLANLSQIAVSVSPTQAGAPVFPTILTAAVSSVTLVNFTTMDRRIQNAYSEQGSLEVEQQVGRSRTLSVGYDHVRGLRLIMSINQNTPSCPPAGTNNGCRPDPDYADNRQYSPRADSRYDGLHVSFTQRPRRWGGFRISYSYSKALDNVGEFFFSSPIDNFDIWKDYGRSDDDQRHRLAFDGVLQTGTGKANTLWERSSHGFRLSGIVQYYSAAPFNITAGSNTIQGTAARPVVDGSYIPRNSGKGYDFFAVNMRLSRSFPIGERLRMEVLAEAFNTLNRVNGVKLNGTFGPGAYPESPLPSFGRMTAVGDPRTLQFALRVRF